MAEAEEIAPVTPDWAVPGTLEPWVGGEAPGPWKLYPFQEDAIEWALLAHRGMLRQDPGGGKTVQGSAVAGAAKPGPVLFVVPSQLTLQWADELSKFIVQANPLELLPPSQRRTEPGGLTQEATLTGLDVDEALPRVGKAQRAVVEALKLQGTLTVPELVSDCGRSARGAVKRLAEVGMVTLEERYTIPATPTLDEYIEAETAAGRRPLVVVGWGSLVTAEQELRRVDWVQLIVDESHYGKESNREKFWRERGEWHSQRRDNRSSVMADIARDARDRDAGILLLTGTPAPNHRLDWWGQLSLLCEKTWRRTATWFKKTFCGAEQGEHGLELGKKTNTEELKRLISRFVHNTDAAIIREQLPGYTIRLEYVEQADQDSVEIDAEYHRLLPKAAKGDRVARGLVREIEASYGARRKRSAGVRTAQACDGRVLLLTTRHADALELAAAVAEACPDRKVLCGIEQSEDGATSLVDAKKRRRMIKTYRASKDAILVATGQAWGTGVDGLQTSSMLILVGLPWTPGELEQWIGRVVRLGQKVPVEIVLLAAEASMDDRLLPQLVEKSKDARRTAWATLAGDVERAVVDPSDAWKKSLQRRMNNRPNWAT